MRQINQVYIDGREDGNHSLEAYLEPHVITV